MNLPVYLDVLYFIKDDFNQNTLREIKHLKMRKKSLIVNLGSITSSKQDMYSFIEFYLEEFYTSISIELLTEALQFP